ncbi:hypothetical protein FQA39_LY10926 [Lamprigera yunnana]|nr:hypothetical protein FQA39_LY10926 [Lamprigera yunnana]
MALRAVATFSPVAHIQSAISGDNLYLLENADIANGYDTPLVRLVKASRSRSITLDEEQIRLNDYSLPSRGRQSTMMWHHRTPPSSEKPRSKATSVALAGAAFLVFIAVLSIAGLALYMGVLRTEAPTQLLTYNCSAKILRGDRFVSNLQEKARKYKQQLEILYHRSNIGSAVASCTVERFGDDSVTIYFRIALNRKALPRNVSNLEKTIKDILLNDSMSRRPIFRHIRFDPKSVLVRKTLENDSLHEKVITKIKENTKPKVGVVYTPSSKQNTNNVTEVPVQKRPDPIFIKKENPLSHGFFEVSKTDADITEKKENNKFISTIKPSTKITAIVKSTTKGASVTNNFYKVGTVSKGVERPTLTTAKTKSTMLTTKPIILSTTPIKTTTVSSTTTTKISNPFFFTIPSHSIDQEPWVPIQGTTEEEHHVIKSSIKTEPKVNIPKLDLEHINLPIYTSFTNPGLSFYSIDLEKLGSTGIVAHPLPVDKIASVTETTFFTTLVEKQSDYPLPEHTLNTESVDQEEMQVSEDRSESFVKVETLKHVPVTTELSYEEEAESTTKQNWELLNVTQTNSEINMVSQSDNTLRKSSTKDQFLKLNETVLLRNISSLFRNLASSLGILPVTATTLTPVTLITSASTKLNQLKHKLEETDESDFGQGHAEVVEVEEDAIMLQEQQTSTKIPLVTLIPVKSNSGVGRPLRPRPHKRTNTTDLVENRSFPNSPFIKNINGDLSSLPIKFVHTEVVTSVSTEINRVKINKHKLNDFKILGILNFESDMDKGTTFTPVTEVVSKKLSIESETDINRNPKEVLKKESSVFSMNSTVSVRKGENHFNTLTEKQLKQLSEISKLHGNLSVREHEPVISNKAISASYTNNNQVGFKILTKTLNKIPDFAKEDLMSGSSVSNGNDCSNYTIKCGDGQCLPDTTRCNQLLDCNDGTDEKDCNCADYLKSQYLLRKICDGVVDCWDFSDENLCDWCTPGQYVCSNSKFCIDRNKICDGIRHCPNGDDERHCVTVAPNIQAADEYPYYSEGYLYIRNKGKWGKLCVQNNVKELGLAWNLSDLGEVVCKSRTYQKLDFVEITNQSHASSTRNRQYFELSQHLINVTKGNLSFIQSPCESKEVVKLKCHALECGTRPQASNPLARIVGGGNAGLGAWPWQAALYKEGEFQCGATLLTDRWLLSAGHCFFHSLDDHWVARIGALRRGTALPSPYEQLRPITQIILHPGYVDVGFVNDISLLQMEIPVIFSDYVRPICLPTSDSVLNDNRICTVIGWGQLFEVGRIFPDTLQEVQVPIISTLECQKHTLFLPLYKITDDMFCAGYDRGGRDACLGDSGGPLMCSEPDGRWVLYGITSNGYGCARANRPGVYTKVVNYLTWIQLHINDRNRQSNKIVKTICHGHRCPLGECLPKSRLCNGYIECSDGSDEKNCPEH